VTTKPVKRSANRHARCFRPREGYGIRKSGPPCLGAASARFGPPHRGRSHRRTRCAIAPAVEADEWETLSTPTHISERQTPFCEKSYGVLTQSGVEQVLDRVREGTG